MIFFNKKKRIIVSNS